MGLDQITNQLAGMIVDSPALEFVALGISFFSLLGVFILLQITRSLHSDDLTSKLIRQNFEDFLALHELRARYPYQGHIFELGDQYETVKAEIIDALREIPAPERRIATKRFALEERALARRIFSQFENAYYQWQNTSRAGDRRRVWFHKDVADYFTNRLLRNPRLAWYWSENGANYKRHYEPGTQRHYARRVVVDVQDSEGPFKSV